MRTETERYNDTVWRLVNDPTVDVMPKIKLPRDTEVTIDLVSKIISRWRSSIGRYEKLERYYRGKHDTIINRVGDEGKPNNKLVSNYAKYITDITTGYFMGSPVTYNADKDKKEALKDVFDVLDDNYEEDVNYELSKDSSISGVGYELVYADSDAKVRFKQMDYKTIIPVYSDDIEESLLFAIRFYRTTDFIADKQSEHAEVYTDTEVISYNLTEEKETDRDDHYFGDVPVVVYLNNEEQMGDFEVVLSLIDAYNQTQSDTANDFEQFTNAYLALSGMLGTTQDDIERAKKDRVFLLDEDGQAKWLIKDVNDSAIENYKSRLQKDIHRFSQTPNLTDEEFASNLSGVALKFKLWGIEQIAAIKERKFRTGLIKRLKLIVNFLNKKGSKYDYNDINITFNRNVPQNLVEWVQMVAVLSGLLSDRTRLSLLPFVDDVDAEQERIKEEEQSMLGDPYASIGDQAAITQGDDQ